MRCFVWQDAAGDGMDIALVNYHVIYEHEGDDPQPCYDLPAFFFAARKFVATLLTLGFGASGGMEAPVVLILEGLSAGFARVFVIRSEYELCTYQLAGIAVVVVILFGAPFTAAFFAMEVVYGDRIIYRKLAYALWAGVVCYWLNIWLRGSFEFLFVGPSHSSEYIVGELGWVVFVVVAVLVFVALGFGFAMI